MSPLELARNFNPRTIRDNIRYNGLGGAFGGKKGADDAVANKFADKIKDGGNKDKLKTDVIDAGKGTLEVDKLINNIQIKYGAGTSINEDNLVETLRSLEESKKLELGLTPDQLIDLKKRIEEYKKTKPKP